MKLRNKKTGEIVDYISFEKGGGQISMYVFDTNKHYYYNSLAELTSDWEDYEEAKEYWHISRFGYVVEDIDEDFDADKKRKEIGNYFETKEEAERAVEKLKAWKRLKDKGFKFIGVRTIGKVIDFVIPRKYCGVSSDSFDEETLEFYHDLDLLFGGKE